MPKKPTKKKNEDEEDDYSDEDKSEDENSEEETSKKKKESEDEDSEEPQDPHLAMMYSNMNEKSSEEDQSEEEQEDEEEEEEPDEPSEPSEEEEEELRDSDREELERRRKESEEEKENSDFMSSLDDAETEDEEKAAEAPEEEKFLHMEYEPVEEDETVEDYIQRRFEEKDKAKKRHKLPKDSEDSDGTEYETIKSGDEEHVNDPIEEKEPLRKLESPPPEPKYYWSQEIYHMEEYDNNFEETLHARFESSAASSSDSDDSQGSYDLPKFKLKAKSNTQERRKNPYNRRRLSNIKSADSKKKKRRSNDKEALKEQSEEMSDSDYGSIDLHVDLSKYDDAKYPEYNSVSDRDGEDKTDTNEANQQESNNKSQKPVVKTIKSKGREKYFLPRKKRNLMFERLHFWYNQVDSTETSEPDEELPSYKAKMAHVRTRDNVVAMAVEKIVEKTLLVVEEIEKARERIEISFMVKDMLLNRCDKALDVLENRQRDEAVKFNLEVLLDKWECEVYSRRRQVIEDRLDQVSEQLVTKALISSIDLLKEEDRLGALVTRDMMAEALDSLQMPREKIDKKLRYFFRGYGLGEHEYTRVEKVRNKELVARKLRDKLVEERKQKIVELSKEEKENIRAERKRILVERNIKFILLDLIRNIKTNKPVEDVEKMPNFQEIQERHQKPFQEDPVDSNEHNEIAEFSEAETTAKKIDTDKNSHAKAQRPKNTRAENKLVAIAERAAMRSRVLKSWHGQAVVMSKETNIKISFWTLLQDASGVSTASEESGSEELEKPQDEEPEEEKEIVEIEYARGFQLPRIAEEMNKAIASKQVPDRFDLVRERQKLVEHHEERNDNALGSDLPKSAERRREQQRESGISSDEDIVLLTDRSDKNKIESIPSIDRDQYLNHWLVNGVSKPYKSPTPPPVQAKQNNFVRKFHRKRPVSAKSEASTIADVAPIDLSIIDELRQQGRLNSALSNRSVAVEESERSSSSSDGESEDERQNQAVDSEQEEASKNSERSKNNKKSSKIEFSSREQTQKDENNNDVAEEDNTDAWGFYLQRKHEQKQSERYKKLKKYKNNHNKNSQNKEKLLTKEKREILEGFEKTVIEEDKMSEEEEVEVLTLNTVEEKDEDESEGDIELERTTTPWEPIKDRPPTPDSLDSEEEVKKFKENYCNKLRKKIDKARNERRLWKKQMEQKNKKEIPKAAWKSPSTNADPQETYATNRELFLRLRIGVRRMQPHLAGRRHLEKRASIGDNLVRTEEDKRRELGEPEPKATPARRARSTPTSVAPPERRGSSLPVLNNRRASVINSTQGEGGGQKKNKGKGFAPDQRNNDRRKSRVR